MEAITLERTDSTGGSRDRQPLSSHPHPTEQQQPEETPRPGSPRSHQPAARVCAHTPSLLPVSSDELFLPQPEGGSACVPGPPSTPPEGHRSRPSLFPLPHGSLSLSLPGMLSPPSCDLTLEVDGVICSEPILFLHPLFS